MSSTGPRTLALIAAAATIASSVSPALAGRTGPDGPPAATSRPAAERTALQEAFASILDEVVTRDGLVRYDRLDDEVRRADLERVVRGYATAERPTERAADLAFLMNAYNANVLLMAATARNEPGFENVLKVDGFFDRTTITVAGTAMTLNGLEKERIRSFGDPRFHAALVCAAESCPPLRAEPFVAARLDEQLDEQSRRWVRDRTKNDVKSGNLELSQIFNWYRSDFEVAPYGGVQGFVHAFAEPGSPLARASAPDRRPEIRFKEYQWRLNQAR